MKIKKLIVRNYKLFDDLELDFTDKKGEISDTIVLAGLNGSGKTTILELIENLINGTLLKKNLQVNTYIQLQLLVNQSFKEVEQEMSASKMSLSIQAFSELQTIITFDFLNDKPQKNNNRYHPYVTETILFSTLVALCSSAPLENYIGVFIYANDKKKDNAKSTNLKRTSFNSDKDNIQKNILNSIQTQVFANPDKPPREVFNYQIDELNKIFDHLNLYSKLVQVSEKELIFESINGQKIHFEDLSSGEKMLYFMGFMLNQLNLENTLILVDQPEDALHPTWQQQITGFFKNIGKNNQVILATHSPQIIASVHPESVFVLGVEDGKRKIKAFNMAAEHKNSYGVDTNRILSEIMGTPIRSFEAQQSINSVNNLIKEMELNPAPSSLVILENQIDTLAIDFGKQDSAVMRLRNELRLLKRKIELMK
jgi:predicted ATP-binding protein involved in virulence